MSNLDLLLNNSMTAISLLLIFVTTLFSIKYEKIKEYTVEDIKVDKPKEKNRQKEKFKKALIFEWSPVIFLNLICVYLLLPSVIEIIKNSHFSFFNFDFIRTAFVLIWIMLILFSIFSIKIAIILITKINECKH
ncbi:MAG: hypothetical protein ACERKV_03925 [Clostridiaceae bacterium]